MQTLYFLLPLLFLREFLDTVPPVVTRLKLLFQHMLWWVGGSVAGVIVMCLMLWLLAGTYFPQPAPWRNAHPVVDGASLVANVRYVIVNFRLFFNTLLDNGGDSGGDRGGDGGGDGDADGGGINEGADVLLDINYYD